MTETTTTVLREAAPKDLLYIDSLRKKNGAALGFIPKAAYESVVYRQRIGGRDRWKYARLLVTVDGDDLTGFCYASCAKEVVTIFQVVVQEDARRWHRALLMADEIERWSRALPRPGITCRVTYDLEANLFWRAIGYHPIKQVISTWLNQRESKSKRPLWEYYKDLHNGLFDAGLS